MAELLKGKGVVAVLGWTPWRPGKERQQGVLQELGSYSGITVRSGYSCGGASPVMRGGCPGS